MILTTHIDRLEHYGNVNTRSAIERSLTGEMEQPELLGVTKFRKQNNHPAICLSVINIDSNSSNLFEESSEGDIFSHSDHLIQGFQPGLITNPYSTAWQPSRNKFGFGQYYNYILYTVLRLYTVYSITTIYCIQYYDYILYPVLRLYTVYSITTIYCIQ